MPPKVLVCDDEEVLRALIRATLEGAYEIIETPTAEESLDYARAERPDVIVLDMMMPGKSGFEVLAELRDDPELAHTPVLMLSARTQVRDRDAAAKAGADRFLAKPFSPLHLATIVAELAEDGR